MVPGSHRKVCGGVGWSGVGWSGVGWWFRPVFGFSFSQPEQHQYLDPETDIFCQFLFWIQKLTLWISFWVQKLTLWARGTL